MKTVALMLILVLSSACCLGIYKGIRLSASGDCPATRDRQCVLIEGSFVVDPQKGPSTEGGYEGIYPFTRFAFSVEPGAKSKFEAALVIANYGNNGPQRANRVVFAESGEQPPFHIYDDREQEISFNDRVRIRGLMIRDCVVKVEKIEKP